MDKLIRACKKLLQEYYGDKFEGLILYGSVARNESDKMSDMDMLVLLNEPFEYFVELKKITEIIYPLQLQSNKLISIKPAALNEFESGVVQLYRNVQSEGVAV